MKIVFAKTVGIGISPIQLALADLSNLLAAFTAGRESHPALKRIFIS